MSGTYSRPERGTGRTFVWALAIFAFMCGAILLLVGGRDCEADGPDDGCGDVRSALEDVQDASNALDEMEYWEARIHLIQAREKLSAAIDASERDR